MQATPMEGPGPGARPGGAGQMGASPGAAGPDATAGSGRHRGPVGLVMGSDSDWPVMRAAYETLAELGVGVEVAVASAHRTPERVRTWALSARERGLRVIIAGAGGAAHLPGVLASWTLLPVIGVPVAHGPAEGGRPESLLGGLEALLSMVQMPPGVPVACVGVNAARNAALLAAQILALADSELAARLIRLRERQARAVEERERRLLEGLSAPPPTGATADARQDPPAAPAGEGSGGRLHGPQAEGRAAVP